MIIGITGGMGCGKSTAARMFAARGFRLLDSDALLRDRVLRAPEVLAAIRQKMGAGVFAAPPHEHEAVAASAAGGFATARLDRQRLAARVFAEPEALRWLEELTHPRLFALWREALQGGARGTCWAVEVPLLFEKGLEIWFDLTVCVASSAVQQIARLEQRGVPEKLAEQRISKQLPLATKLARADLVLWNDGGLLSLESQVEQVISRLADG